MLISSGKAILILSCLTAKSYDNDSCISAVIFFISSQGAAGYAKRSQDIFFLHAPARHLSNAVETQYKP